LASSAIIVVGQTIVVRTPPKRWQRETLTGLLFGVAAMVAMANPFEVTPGHIVDVRNVVTALAGPCGGMLAAVLTGSLAGLYRAYIGGAGALSGIAGIIVTTVVVFFSGSGIVSLSDGVVASSCFGTHVLPQVHAPCPCSLGPLTPCSDFIVLACLGQ
jgi:hypothetical protein